MTSKKKLLVIQEILTTYRCQLFHDISELSDCDVTFLAETAGQSFGVPDLSKFKFTFIKAQWINLFGLFKHDWKTIKLWSKNDVILHIADFKFVSLWVLLLLTKFTSKKIFLHGQGGYKRQGLLTRIVYTSSILFCDGYVCYTEYSRDSLFKKIPKFLHGKITVCDNMLLIDPVETVLEENQAKALFYIGRLRQGCGIEILLDAAIKADVKVEVIGVADSEYLEILQSEFGEVARFHGAIFDLDKQQAISRHCFAGAYGGDAGLSVVHYMALGLPVIVHGQIHNHMGPEPSYVEDGVNGLFFDRNDSGSLANKINQLTEDDALRHSMALSSLDTFKQLSSPTMAEKMVTILGLPK